MKKRKMDPEAVLNKIKSLSNQSLQALVETIRDKIKDLESSGNAESSNRWKAVYSSVQEEIKKRIRKQ